MVAPKRTLKQKNIILHASWLSTTLMQYNLDMSEGLSKLRFASQPNVLHSCSKELPETIQMRQLIGPDLFQSEHFL